MPNDFCCQCYEGYTLIYTDYGDDPQLLRNECQINESRLAKITATRSFIEKLSSERDSIINALNIKYESYKIELLEDKITKSIQVNIKRKDK